VNFVQRFQAFLMSQLGVAAKIEISLRQFLKSTIRQRWRSSHLLNGWIH